MPRHVQHRCSTTGLTATAQSTPSLNTLASTITHESLVGTYQMQKLLLLINKLHETLMLLFIDYALATPDQAQNHCTRSLALLPTLVAPITKLGRATCDLDLRLPILESVHSPHIFRPWLIFKIKRNLPLSTHVSMDPAFLCFKCHL